MSEQKGRRALFALVPLLMALAFALVFATFNTPLGPTIGSDNAIYLTMGTAVAQGYRPYADVFDHKGPLLFLLQAVPQAIAGGYSTLAVFVMEVLFLWACLLALGLIARRLGAPAPVGQSAYLALTCFLMDGGNLTEEYTALFTLTGLWLALRAFGDERQLTGRALTLHAMGMGAMTMLAFLLRANNALPLCAVTLALAAYLAVKRQFASLGRCAGGFTLGLLLAALPFVLWLAAEGVLEDAFYGSILHNMMYAGTRGGSRLDMLLHNAYGFRAIFLAACSCFGALALCRRCLPLGLALFVGAAGAGLSAFISHKFYMHYLMLGAPLSAMGICAVVGAGARAHRRRNGAVMAALLLLFACLLCRCGADELSRRGADERDYEALVPDAQALYALVPEDERSSFMAYRVEPRWYVASRALPCMRFYFLQEVLAQADPAVMDEIVETFENDPPRWLVIYYNRAFGPPYDPRVAEIFETSYEFVDAKGTYQLRRLKEDR